MSSGWNVSIGGCGDDPNPRRRDQDRHHRRLCDAVADLSPGEWTTNDVTRLEAAAKAIRSGLEAAAALSDHHRAASLLPPADRS